MLCGSLKNEPFKMKTSPLTGALILVKTAVRFVSTFPREAVVWAAGLLMLAFADPGDQQHVTICPVALSGVEWCPGCGLGRSVSFLFKGSVIESFNAHPLGLFAVIVLSFRIYQLTKAHLKSYGTRN